MKQNTTSIHWFRQDLRLRDNPALNASAKNGKVIAYKFKGKRFDCGNVIGYVKATNYFAKMQKFI